MNNGEVKEGRLPVFRERFNILRGDMSNTEFAESLGMSRQTVGFYLNGDRIPDAIVLRQIAEKCQVSANWLLGLSDFITESERDDADEMYKALMGLMADELDEADKKRVRRSLSTVISGFRDSMCNYLAYTCYENATLYTTLSLATAAGCAKLAQTKANEDISDTERDELFIELDRILSGAAMTAYKEMGYFFSVYRKAIMEELKANDHREISFEFAHQLESLKKTVETP